MALTYKTLSLKKFLFIFLSCLLFQQLTAQTIVKFDNGNNIIYKNLQGKTIVKNKKYTIAFTDTISKSECVISWLSVLYAQNGRKVAK